MVHAAVMAASKARERRLGNKAMVWFFIEAGVALLLAIFIVWFTMGGRRKPPRSDQNDREKN